MDNTILTALGPVLILLALAILAAVVSKMARTSPIVGYLLLGVALKAVNLQLVTSANAIATMASLGVMFLLFELGLHFPLTLIQQRAADIFGFGPVQVLLGTAGLGLIGVAAGVPATGALILGARHGLDLVEDRERQRDPLELDHRKLAVRVVHHVDCLAHRATRQWRRVQQRLHPVIQGHCA